MTVIGARAGVHVDEKPLHAKYSLGNKKVVYSSSLIIDQADAATLEQDEEFTLMNWGNAIVKKITHSWNPLHLKEVTGLEVELHLQGDVRTTKKKITWLSTDQDLVPVDLVEFDYLITKDKIDEGENIDDFLNPRTEIRTPSLADCNVAALRENDVMQFDRKGYYRVDRPFLHGEPAVFFEIPTGKAK